ncbi:hypothetical protein D9M69_423250 [compost metagenome]
MDLQHHLVRHQQQVGDAAGRVGRQQQLQGLVRHPGRGAGEAQVLQDFHSALLAAVIAAEAAGLAVVAVEGGDADARVSEAQVLPLLGAGAVEVELLMALEVQVEAPVDQARVGGNVRRLLGKQLEALGKAGAGLVKSRRAVAGAGRRRLHPALVDQGVAGDLPGQRLGPLQGTLQAGQAEVRGGRVGLHPGQTYAEHGAHVLAEGRRFGDAAAQQGLLAGLADNAQGMAFGAGGKVGETLPETIEHGTLPGPVKSVMPTKAGRLQVIKDSSLRQA